MLVSAAHVWRCRFQVCARQVPDQTRRPPCEAQPARSAVVIYWAAVMPCRVPVAVRVVRAAGCWLLALDIGPCKRAAFLASECVTSCHPRRRQIVFS